MKRKTRLLIAPLPILLLLIFMLGLSWPTPYHDVPAHDLHQLAADAQAKAGAAVHAGRRRVGLLEGGMFLLFV